MCIRRMRPVEPRGELLWKCVGLSGSGGSALEDNDRSLELGVFVFDGPLAKLLPPFNSKLELQLSEDAEREDGWLVVVRVRVRAA